MPASCPWSLPLKKLLRGLASWSLVLAIIVILDATTAWALRDSTLMSSLVDEYWIDSPLYDHDLPRNTDRQVMWLSTRYRMATNDLGFKDKMVRQVPLSVDRPRLLIIGDSFTEGVGVPFEQTYAGRVAEALDKQGVDVLNAGVFSYFPAIYYRKIKYLIEEKGLRFDAVWLMMDMSDVVDSAMAPPFDAAGNLPKRLSPGQRLANFLKDHSLIVRVADRVKDLLQYRKAIATAHEQPKYILGLGKALWSVDPELRTTLGEPGLKRAAENMDRLAELLRRHGIPLSVGVYPWPDNIWHHDRDSLQVRFWRDWSRRQGAAFIDLFPLFVNDHPRETVLDSYFIAYDNHWNADGHAMVAETLLRTLPPPVNRP